MRRRCDLAAALAQRRCRGSARRAPSLPPPRTEKSSDDDTTPPPPPPQRLTFQSTTSNGGATTTSAAEASVWPWRAGASPWWCQPHASCAGLAHRNQETMPTTTRAAAPPPLPPPPPWPTTPMVHNNKNKSSRRLASTPRMGKSSSGWRFSRSPPSTTPRSSPCWRAWTGTPTRWRGASASGSTSARRRSTRSATALRCPCW
mmetsp:Transcript_12367/g.29871  ORF Transcript_12367/g.29871 Transcript_12367/m.29871 type:complete len:202 (+) Transcript_12367:73-678(+)